MKLMRVHAREIAMRLVAPFETSFGVLEHRRIILIELETDSACGWGEVTAGEGPFYNPETTDTAWSILRNFLIPLVLGKQVASPGDVDQLMAPVRGHEMAKASIETACWDAFAQERNVSLATALGANRPEIACGVSLGIQKDTQRLLDRIAEELDAGYQRIKLKIKPSCDVAVVEAVRRKYPTLELTVDANSAYTIRDLPLLKRLDEFNLGYIEQPLEWNEIYGHAELQRQMSTPICLDESIHNLRDARAAIELGACRVLNVKLGRVGGHAQADRIQEFALKHRVPVWSGGMFESGIGRAHNVAMSALAGFVLPGDVSASRRYWERDVIQPEITVTPGGTIIVPKEPGIGHTVDMDYLRSVTVREQSWNV